VKIYRPYKKSCLTLAALAALSAPLAFAQDHEHMHTHDAASQAEAAGPAGADGRIAVKYPAMLKEHTLANMRDHLQTLSQIQAYLADKEFDRAAEIAEKRLGMSSLSLHGAHEVAPYMPKGMQDAGTAMHHAASQFAVATQEAAIDHDVPRALGALNKVTQACVACHAAYRLE
jgi:cytochrome c556